jgi:hypothetical protein
LYAVVTRYLEVHGLLFELPARTPHGPDRFRQAVAVALDDDLMQTSVCSVPASIQCPVTHPSSVIPPNGLHSRSITRARKAGPTGVPSFQVVGTSVVNFIGRCPPWHAAPRSPRKC